MKFQSNLSQTGFSGGDITPLLDNGLLHLPGVSSGPGAHLLGDINTLLGGLQLGDKLGHMGTGSLGLQGAFFLGGILDNSLCFVKAFFSSLLESTSSRGTQLPRLLGTSSNGGVLLDLLLGHRADLPGPLGALGQGCISRGFISTLLILDSFTFNNIIFNIMNLLLGPAFRFIFSSTDLRSLDITILDQGGSAHLDGLIEGNLLVVDEAVLPEVLLALLLLLGFVVGDVGGVTPPVIRMVALDNFIVFSLFNHLNLVNASLTISSRTSSSYSWETDICISSTLTISTRSNVLRGDKASRGLNMFMMITMGMGISTLSVEGEGVEERALTTCILSTATKGSGTISSSDQK